MDSDPLESLRQRLRERRLALQAQVHRFAAHRTEKKCAAPTDLEKRHDESRPDEASTSSAPSDRGHDAGGNVA